MPVKLTRSVRGDTIIEVMFAIALFSLVAVLSVAMMNAGVADAERALELVTARNEINAQAEAIRFIHSSYVSELTLPDCSAVTPGEACQQYQALWEKIVGGAMEPSNAISGGYSITDLYGACRAIYADANPDSAYRSLLASNNAYVINTRELVAPQATGASLDKSYISVLDQGSLFAPALLNARIIFTAGNPSAADVDSSVTTISDATSSLAYRKVARAEGLWVVTVNGDPGASGPKFYDFHINACWYGSNSNVPTVLDTVMRLYNPENI